MTGGEARLEDLLEIGAAAKPSGVAGPLGRTSKIAKTSLGLGILAGATGLASVLCDPPRNGFMLPDVSDPLTAAIIVTVLASALGVLLAVIGCIRIAASGKQVTGYGLCLGGVGLAIVGNAIWLAYFSFHL